MKLKRQKYQDICKTCQESFHPFKALIDSMLAPEATKILQHLAHITADKKQKPYSAIFVNQVDFVLPLPLSNQLTTGSEDPERSTTKQPPSAPQLALSAQP
jgi:hypothetical protein